MTLNDEGVPTSVDPPGSSWRVFGLDLIPMDLDETGGEFSLRTSGICLRGSWTSKRAKILVKTSGTIIKSPIVGTAYLAPEPGGEKFIEVGKKIKKGDTIIIVEAMKTMNHIPSTSDGVVKQIFVEDGEPVEFDQKIVILD